MPAPIRLPKKERKAAHGTQDGIAGRREGLRQGIVRSDDDMVKYSSVLCNMVNERCMQYDG